MAPAHTQVFEDAITISPLSSHTYSANLRDEWCIGAVPHGGYTTCVLARLAKTHFAHTHPNLSTSPATPISVQLSFLRRTDVGPALLTVEDMKIGARTSTIHVLLKQRSKSKNEEEVKVAGYITLSPAAAETGITAKTSWTLHPPPPPGSSGPVNLRALAAKGRDGNWIRIPAPFVQFRRAAANVELYGPDPASFSPETNASRRAIVDQWARFRPLGSDKKPLEGRWTDDTIGFLVDMFPMMLDGFDVISTAAQDPTLATKGKSQGKTPRGTFWYPTVTLNVDYKKRLPAEGVEWLYCRVQTKAVKNGRTDIDVTVLDESGEIVALATQVGLVVSASRNLAGRDLKKVKVDAQGKANL
ncbi:hypothetical protein Plec18170_008851 [Paecilomyces lecythidis]